MTRHHQPGLVELDELARDLLDRRTSLGPRSLPVRSAELVERGRFSTGVWSEHVDLLGRDVELVVTPVLEQEVVARRSVHCAGDHPAVAGDSVLAVNDVVARRQIVEEPVGRSRPCFRGPVRPAPARHVVLGEHGDQRCRNDEPLIELRHRDVDTGARKRAVVRIECRVESLFCEHVDHACGRALGPDTDRHGETVFCEPAELKRKRRTVAVRRRPPTCGDLGCSGTFGHRHEVGHRCPTTREQPVERDVEARERGRTGFGISIVGQSSPGLCECLSQSRLVALELRRSIARSPGIDEHDLRLLTEQVREDDGVVHEPGEPGLHAVEPLTIGQAVPLRASPWLALQESEGTLTHLECRDELPATEHHGAVERLDRPLVTGFEGREPIDLVPPQVDTHR